MLRITKKQLEVFSIDLIANFERNAAIYLKSNYPQTAGLYNEEQLEKLIKEGRRRAFTFDIKESDSVCAFLEYILCLGIDFELKSKDVWVKRILLINNINGSEKIVRLRKILSLKPTFK